MFRLTFVITVYTHTLLCCILLCFPRHILSQWLWLPIVTTAIGGIFGFVQVSIVSALIAQVLVSVPYTIGIDIAAGVGIAQGLIFLYFHMGRAEFIHR